MTVAQLQYVNQIDKTTPDTIERLGWIVCHLFGLSEDRVNRMNEGKFFKLVAKVERMMAAKPSRLRRVVLQTDATKITLGQFIECQHWLKNDLIQVLDLVAASIKIKRTDHATDALKMKGKPFTLVLPKVNEFVLSMNSLIKNYSELFEIYDDEEAEERQPENVHPFMQQYSWLYSASEIAAYEGIPLDKAYDLPVLQAFNGLAYLKSKAAYEKWKAKK